MIINYIDILYKFNLIYIKYEEGLIPLFYMFIKGIYSCQLQVTCYLVFYGIVLY